MLISFERFPARQLKHARSILEFSAQRLMKPELTQQLTVHVTGNRNLLKNTQCLALVDSNNFNGGCRDFEIEIDTSVRKRTWLTALAHEMVHIKQMAVGDLSYTKLHTVRWRKQKVELASQDYYDLPWEIEAHGREMGLFVRWCEQHQLSKYAWTQISI